MARLLSASLSAILLFASCSGTSAPDTHDQIRSSQARNLSPSVALEDAARLATDNLAFGVDLYGQLRANHAGNFIFSQTSISLALAMLYGGAANRTASQMATALHFSLPPERLHPAFDALDLALRTQATAASSNDFQLRIANALWLQAGFTPLPAYLDLLAKSYGAGLFVEDFAGAPEAARLEINRWVSDQTQQMIPELFGPGTIDAGVCLAITNAVYFHGAWQTPFDANSQMGTFHAPTRDVRVPMMSTLKENNASLWSGAGYQAASLSYSGAATMILVMPDAGTYDSFEQGLTADGLAGILAPTTLSAGSVQMPSFGFATASPLDDVLQALGMTDAFEPGLADFSAIDGKRTLSVRTVIHKAVISVDEAGTKAAAATGTTLVKVGLTMPPANILVIDRPFLFFIRHDPTGAILFQGRVLDPSQSP